MKYLFEKDTNEPQRYYWFKKALTKGEVEKVMKLVSKLPEAKKATTLSRSNDDKDYVRSSRVKWIPKNSDFDWLYKRMIYLAEQANNDLWKFNLYSAPEEIQYTEYHASEKGHYNWHQDIGAGRASLRKVSITIQMSDSDEYEGGDLEISTGGDEDGGLYSSQRGPRGLGVGVLFPSFLMHRVSPITKGVRKSLVLWVGGEHYK
jgi:PKHD-type hydroxylase